ncbi:BspA family leucine-rich repeat surface protein, partial [Enterococcus faecalis]|uniref:BspA family leucine-rich repeat surface protein n=1 Tax=Enterococcus faecalis TaxID=1351 RepID=UPI00032F2556
MNYKKIISVSFATLLLANTGAPVVVNATTSSTTEAMDEEVLKDIFDSSADFNSIKMMNEIKKDNVEVEQQEETENKKERSGERTTSNDEVKVDKEVEDTTKEDNKKQTSDKVTNTEVSKEPESITEEDHDSSNEENNTIVQESEIEAKAGISIHGYWGSCEWAYSSTTESYTIYSGGTIGTGAGNEKVAPWLRTDSVLLSTNPPSSFTVTFQPNISISGFLYFFDSTSASPTAVKAAREKLKGVTFEGAVDATNSKGPGAMFQYGAGLLYVQGLRYFKWESITNAYAMFEGCSKIREITISGAGWKFAQNVNVIKMFEGASALRYLEISDITYSGKDLSLLNEMGLNKSNNPSLNSIYFLGWNSPNLEDASHLKSFFKEVSHIKYAGFRDLVKRDGATELPVPLDMSYLFTFFENIEKLDVSGWQTSNVKNMKQAFGELSYLREISGLSDWDTSNVTDMSRMFVLCGNLKQQLDLSRWNTSNVTDMSDMFYNTSSMTELDVSNWDTSNVANMRRMFEYSGVTELDLSNWNFSNVTSAAGMFASSDIQVLNLSGSTFRDYKIFLPDTNSLIGPNIVEIDMTDMKVTESFEGFNKFLRGCPNLSQLSMDNAKLSSDITDMSYLFSYVEGLKAVSLSGMDTSNITSMRSLFAWSDQLTVVNTDRLNTSNVTDMSDMFYNTSSLTELDVSNWDTSNVANMRAMFASASSLTELDVSNWDT